MQTNFDNVEDDDQNDHSRSPNPDAPPPNRIAIDDEEDVLGATLKFTSEIIRC